MWIENWWKLDTRVVEMSLRWMFPGYCSSYGLERLCTYQICPEEELNSFVDHMLLNYDEIWEVLIDSADTWHSLLDGIHNFSKNYAVPNTYIAVFSTAGANISWSALLCYCQYSCVTLTIKVAWCGYLKEHNLKMNISLPGLKIVLHVLKFILPRGG